MNNLLLLLKNNILVSLGGLRGKNGKRSTLSAILFLLLGVCLIVGVYAYQTLSTFDLFIGYGHPELTIFNAISNAILIALCLSLLRMSLLSKTNDSDFLLSLPIKKQTIVISKILTNLIYDLLFILVIYFPCIVIYFVKFQFSATILFSSIAFVILVSIIADSITYILNFISNILFSKFKLGKLFSSLFYLVLFALIMVFIFSNTSYLDYLLNNNIESFYSSRPITNFLLNFITNPNLINMLIFTFTSFILLLCAWSLYTFSFGKSYTYTKSSKKELTFKQNYSPFFILYKKEISNYFSTPSYLINTIIGPVMILLLPFLQGFFGLENSMETSKDLIAGFLSVIITLLLATTLISASSISLEGKNLWILKTSPIKEKTIFLAKILTHLTVTLPALVISCLTFIIIDGYNFTQFMIVFSLPFLFNFLVAVVGLFFNLCLPLLEFDNEMKVVKQSMAVFTSMIFGFIVAMLPLALFYLTKLTPLTIYLISISSVVLLLIIFTILLFTKGVKLFKKL